MGVNSWCDGFSCLVAAATAILGSNVFIMMPFLVCSRGPGPRQWPDGGRRGARGIPLMPVDMRYKLGIHRYHGQAKPF